VKTRLFLRSGVIAIAALLPLARPTSAANSPRSSATTPNGLTEPTVEQKIGVFRRREIVRLPSGKRVLRNARTGQELTPHYDELYRIKRSWFDPQVSYVIAEENTNQGKRYSLHNAFSGKKLSREPYMDLVWGRQYYIPIAFLNSAPAMLGLTKSGGYLHDTETGAWVTPLPTHQYIETAHQRYIVTRDNRVHRSTR
jgi:hypothetical protein